MLVDRDDPLDPDVSNRMHWNTDARSFRVQVRQHANVPVGHALSPLRLVIVNRRAIDCEQRVVSSRGIPSLTVRGQRWPIGTID